MVGALIGRERELAELRVRATEHRLISVVGPGGVGKTALARAAAPELAPGFPMGVRVVDLTRVTGAAAVAAALAAQLGFDSWDALLGSPVDLPALLVLDNCEHVLDAAAAAVIQLLGSCPQLTVVTTSRAPLEVPGESIVALAPLPVPPAGAAADESAASPAVAMFLARARDAGVGVDAADPDGDLAAVADLCRRVDGLPLAIEIAAARARTMSVGELVERLAAPDGVNVLDRPRFRGDPRHRSVSDTIRWSYDLLPTDRAALLDALSVYVGPFTADGARAVAGAGDPDRALDDLVAASLVAVDTSEATTSYRLLDTVRSFARARLDERDAVAATHDRFVDSVLDRLRTLTSGSAAAWRPAIVRDLMASFDDLAAALQWCVAHDTDRTRAYRLCAPLWGIVHQGRADEIAGLIGLTLERWPDDGSPGGAQASAVLATAEYVTGSPRPGRDRAVAAAARLRRPGPPMVTLYRVLGQVERALGDLAASRAAFLTGAEVAHSLGSPAMAVELEIAAALVLADLGDVDPALVELDDSLARAEAIGSPLSVCWARTALGWVQLRRDPARAAPTIARALAEARECDFPVAVAVGLRSQAYERLLADDTAGAAAAATDLLHDLMQRGALSNGRLLLDATAAVAFRAGVDAWDVVAATARAAPITTVACAQFELVEMPATRARPQPRVDWLALARNVLAEVTDPPEPAHQPMNTPVAAAIRQSGGLAEFTYAGRSASLRVGKGVADLIRVIEADGRDLHCLDLAGAQVQEASTGPVIDAAARSDYERRIRDLQADIDEAEDANDFERAYRCQAELDALVDHLTAALGRGNRVRRAPDSAERARSAVTHRIRTTIRQVERLHPALGRHLSRSVNTGYYCSYRPELPVAWTVSST